MLRHTLATLAYRAGKALRGAPPDFSGFAPAPGSRSAGQILAHLCDLRTGVLDFTNNSAVANATSRFCRAARRLRAALARRSTAMTIPLREMFAWPDRRRALQHTAS